MPITKAFIEEIERQIDKGNNGDVDRMELRLMMGIYNKIVELEVNLKTNPIHRLGEVMRDNKCFALLVSFIVWVLAILFPQMIVALMGIDHIVAP